MNFKSFLLKHRTLTVLILSLLLGATSCTKEYGSYDVYSPVIAQPGLADGKATLAYGETVVLAPQLMDALNTTYVWKVNGVVVSTDPTYTFSSDKSGNYVIEYVATNAAGTTSYQYNIKVGGEYLNGIILVNEGWFGHENGNVNFYRYGRDTIEHMVYHKQNPGKDLGVTTQYGAIWNDKLYLVSKQRNVVIVDAGTMIETGRVNLPADGRAFVGIDANTGIISTANGLYQIDLNTLTLGNKIGVISGDCGNLYKDGSHLYVINQTQGLLILNLNDYSIARTISGITMGIAKTQDGSLWAAGFSSLVKINPSTLTSTTVTLPFTLGNPWTAWNDGVLTASSKTNDVFVALTNSWGAGGTQLYRYIDGNPGSLAAPFITLPANQEFYGSGVRYNPVKDELVVTAVQSGYSANYSYNNLYFYDVTNGNLKKSVPYQHYYFPALMLFPN